MHAKRFLISLLIAISFYVLGCSLIQAQPTSTPSEPTLTVIEPTSTQSKPILTPNEPTSSPNDGKYRPPSGNYACDLSSKQGPGSRLDEYHLPSSFETVQSDDFGGWTSIEFMGISDEFLPIPEPVEERKKYLDYDLNALMERRINSEISNAKIIEQEYLQKDTTILLAILDLPGGSNMTKNGEYMDTTRGVYIVIHGAYSYVISTQFTDVFDAQRSQQEIIQQLKQDLEDFYATCEFQGNP